MLLPPHLMIDRCYLSKSITGIINSAYDLVCEPAPDAE
jgi:hypothetical protein